LAKLADIFLKGRKREKRVVGAGTFALKRLLGATIATAGDDSEDLTER
jgi:hypothetical protein